MSKKRKLTPAQKIKMQRGKQKKAESGEKPQGTKLYDRIKEILKERSRDKDGKYNTRFDDTADAFVKCMESGSFVHLKEFLDRDSGKPPLRLSDAEGKNMKFYVGMPVDDEEEAP